MQNYMLAAEKIRQATLRARKSNPLIGVSVKQGSFRVNELHPLPHGKFKEIALTDFVSADECVAFLDAIKMPEVQS